MARNKYPEKTQKLIIEVATKLFMEKGYEKTSLNDIVKNLGGLTKGAIYQHFSSKEDIYQAVIYQMSAKNDDNLLSLIQNKDLNGLQKIKLALSESLDAAIDNSGQLGNTDYSKNPQMLYSLIRELQEEIAPMFIRPLIEQGIADGSIKTDYPKELSEMLAILINLWINPLVFKASPNDTANKLMFLSEMLSGYNLNIIDDELIKKIKLLSNTQKSEKN
ncbi:MAG: TetR/AcrR family transcriptional regulator [Clostridia bacterium]|nr:TetR/AcrR family transcriptional regulator [Clostridia bacterium]